MSVSYDLSLVILSVLIAILSAYTATNLTERIVATKGVLWLLWLSGGAICLGLGIWAMHFVGMLAFHLPVPIGYHLASVLVSVIPAVLASGFALWIVSHKDLRLSGLLGASLFMGMGIAGMHYTGMAAIRLPAIAHYNLLLVAFSVLIAVGVSFAALWIMHRLEWQETLHWWQKIGAATLMGLAVPSMHYSGMAAVWFSSLTSASEMFFTPDTTWLSSLISAIAFSILGLALLISSETKVGDRTKALSFALAQLQQSQLQLVQSEKMSSLGQLVAGVAHEINNPVGFIHGNLSHAQKDAKNLLTLVQLYQQYYPNPIPEIQAKSDEIDLEFIQDDLPQMLTSMQLGTDRIREIVLSLRNFSRLDEPEFKTVDIHEGIESTLLILKHRCKAKPERPEIEVLRNYGHIPLIECYAGQLNQVFMNILANAIDALDERSAKHSFQENQENPSQITILTLVSDSQSVKIIITDNGIGMSESVQQQLFQPFFTTKPAGKGTGIGMSISHQIITEKHQGTLECFSSPGNGTKFVIQIPIRQQG